MITTESKTLKQYCKEAKNRLKTGFWQNYHQNLSKELTRAEEQGISNCTTTELCLKFNKKVSMVKGSSKSFKITTKEDIELFKALLEVELNNLI